jgi:UDP:flavonoid glycosyltransferase YjiC (YdhE family)
MRVLLVTAPLLGHLFPLVPLATALRDQGHDARFATASEAASAPTDGVPVQDVAAPR